MAEILEVECPNCRGVIVLTEEAQRRITGRLALSPASAREIVECHCGLGAVAVGLTPSPRRTA